MATISIDAEGYERRTKKVGSIHCRCGKRVRLTCETHVWIEVIDTRLLPLKWRHKEYGDPVGFCECGYAYSGMPDGRMVRLDLREKRRDA